MKNFLHYMRFKQVEPHVQMVGQFLAENQQQANPASVQKSLESLKQQFATTFKQQFDADPNTALTWLNNFIQKELPASYKTYYQQSQQNPNQQQQQPQQNQQQT